MSSPHSRIKKTFLPAASVSTRASPTAGWVSALGHALMIHSWISKPPHGPSLLAGVSPCECALRLTGSSGKQPTPLTLRVHPFESKSGACHSEIPGELHSPELPTILSLPCGAWLLMLPRLRLSFQMAMRSYFVLREGLSDTSSQVAENHCLFIVGKVRTESVCKTRSRRRNFCNQWGIGEPPTSRVWQSG